MAEAEAPRSDLDICNNALALLGVDPIQSLTGEGLDSNAEYCAQFYPQLRDTLLSAYPWRFATKKAELGRLTEDPPAEWSRGFQLPADILGLPDEVFQDASSDIPISRYDIFGKQLWCDEDHIFIDYRWKAPEAQWGPLFVQLVETALAARLAVPITEDRQLAADLRTEAYGTPQEGMRGGLFKVAAATHGINTPNKKMMKRGGPLLQARRGFAGGGYGRGGSGTIDGY